MDIIQGLNPAQREAVETIQGPVLILAGPGSGKTRVITHRIAYLIKVCGISPHRILAVTFTNKAAKEMTERLGRLAAASVKDLTLGTFHSICARILRIEGQAAGISRDFVIYDQDDQISLVKRTTQDAGYDTKQFPPQSILSVISAAKSQMITPESYKMHSGSHFEKVVGEIYEQYQRELQKSNALDFDDLLMKTVQLFDSKPEILLRYQNRYIHILVDEFQDTNLVQYRLVKQLGGKYRNVCVVGDPDQSIYSWRSADLRNILNFEKDFPEAKVVLLEQNYRSTKTILQAASCIISAGAGRKQKRLWTENETGELVTVIEAYNEQEEAQFVVKEIDRLVEQGKASLKDCAVMFRTNAQSRALEETFIRYGMPYRLVAGTRFYERKEIKDIIAYLKLVQNPNDSVSLLRIINIPARGIGDKSLAQLDARAKSRGVSIYEALKSPAEAGDDVDFDPRSARVLKAFYIMIEDIIRQGKTMNLDDLFRLVISKTGFEAYIKALPDGEERWENIEELGGVARRYAELGRDEGLTSFLEGVTLISDVDSYDESVGAVTLITLHQAKGLEFPVVFIVGLEEGILPHIRSFDDPAQMEEERRLCYVGITRAKKLVYLLHTFHRNRMGGGVTSIPSRFLKDIPGKLISGGDSRPGQDKAPAAKQREWDDENSGIELDLPELKIGDIVRHRQFGEGKVTGCRMLKNDAEVVINFKETGQKRLLLSFAGLEKVEED